jgi:hypothetical protein
MIQDPYNPNPRFFMLSEHDMIMKNDEYYDFTEDAWCTVDDSHIGDLYKGPYGYTHFLIIRRKNPKFVYSHERWI